MKEAATAYFKLLSQPSHDRTEGKYKNPY